MTGVRALEADMGSDAHPPFAHPNAVDRPLAEFVLAHTRDRPDAIAVMDEDGELSYAALVALAARIEDQVAAAAAGKAPIGILMPVSTGYIATILALLARGTPYVPLDEGYPAARNAEIAQRAGLQAIIVNSASDAAAREIAPELVRIVLPVHQDGGRALLPVTATPDDVAVIFYTSGSTGRPKGVYQSQRATAYEALRHCWRAGLRHGDRVALLYSPAAAGSTRDIQGSLLAGAQLCIVDVKRQGIGPAIRLLADWRVTVLHVMPGLFRAAFATDHADAARLAGSVRLVHLISDRVLKADVELYKLRFPRRCRLCIDIAATEISASSYASWNLDHETVIDRDLVPVGYPRSDMLLTLVAPQGREVPQGELGEIVVTGHSLALGYWNDPEATAKAFSPSTRLEGATDYRTGDLGRLLPDGLLEFVGRKDRQVKLRGQTVHLAEVEAGLARCPGIVEVGAMVRQSGGDARLIAYCVSAASRDADRQALAAWSAVNLPPAMRPQEIVMLDALPRLPNGKPDAAALAVLDRRAARRPLPAPIEIGGVRASVAASAVQEAWRQLLDPGAFAADLSFAESGGDSLKAMNLILLLEERLGFALATDILDLQTTPTNLIARLNRPEAAANVSRSNLPALYIFPGIFGADLDANDFARRMATRFVVTMADYRWGGNDFSGRFSGEAMIGEAVRRIVAQAPARLWLLGHSFGGKLAVEVARRLLNSEIPVERIMILDGAPTDDTLRDRETVRRIEPTLLRLRQGVSAEGIFAYIPARLHSRSIWLAGMIARGLVARRQYRLARWLVAMLDNRWLRHVHLSARRWVIAKTRSLAFGHLPVSAKLSAELTLVVSQERRYPASLYPDLGWNPYFSRIDSIPVAVSHADFFDSGANGPLIRLLDERLAAGRS